MEKPPDLEKFQFRGLHPLIHMGTASDRYAGWIGQVYSEDRYKGRITERSKKLGGKSYKERVLPENTGNIWGTMPVWSSRFPKRCSPKNYGAKASSRKTLIISTLISSYDNSMIPHKKCWAT